MVNNFVNKKKNYLSPQIIVHKKDQTFGLGISCTDLARGTKNSGEFLMDNVMASWLLILGSSKATQIKIIDTLKKILKFVSTLENHTLAQQYMTTGTKQNM